MAAEAHNAGDVFVVEVLVEAEVDDLLLAFGEQGNDAFEMAIPEADVLGFDDVGFDGWVRWVGVKNGYLRLMEAFETDAFLDELVAERFEQVGFDKCGFGEKIAALPEFEVELLNGVTDEIGVGRKLGSIVVQRPVMRLGKLSERLRVAGLEPLPEPDIQLAGI